MCGVRKKDTPLGVILILVTEHKVFHLLVQYTKYNHICQHGKNNRITRRRMERRE